MKGQWKTVESMLAGVVILLFLAVISATYMEKPADFSDNGQKALNDIYMKGMLREFAAQGDTMSIDDAIEETGYLSGLSHAVSICDYSGSCTGSVPESSDVWTSRIILSGDDTYQPMEVILYVFR
ncbi:MAG: hypothetical protein JW789_04510 [Candidatus Aenigmarchaeota archaeon]|nr:hypothetical protein [Candidatus Aenigmarchaeota archaeon]